MQRLGTPRPRRRPGARTTFGHWGVMLPSQAYGTASDSGALTGQGTPTYWTPYGVFAPGERAWHPAPYTRAGGQASRSPGAWVTPPVFFQMIGVADGFLLPHQQVPAPGRPFQGTPVVYAKYANPFPSAAPPTPSLPLPAAWPGRL